ncbi:hypothetical protein F7725_007312, partial [Dissostichus mawsoni]
MLSYGHRYLDQEGKLWSQFLDLICLTDGKADSIVLALKNIIQMKGIPVHLIFGLGTDGTAVMTEDVPYMATFRDHLEHLHLYFRNSANRSASLKAAAEVLGVCELKVKQVKDTRWLSQHEAVKNLSINISAVLGALADEVETRKCPTAKGLYSFLATYRFIAALHLQADVLPHLARLSKLFQREDVMFLAIKEQVPVTLPLLKGIKDSGGHQPGSHLARLNQSLDDPSASLPNRREEEEARIIQGADSSIGKDFNHRYDYFTDIFPPLFDEVMDPYLDGLIAHLERRFSENKTQLDILSDLSSKYEEFGVLYPTISQLAAIALTVPVSSVKTNIRNRLQGDHLAACIHISINGPEVSGFPYQEALETFFRKPRKIPVAKIIAHCVDKQIDLLAAMYGFRLRVVVHCSCLSSWLWGSRHRIFHFWTAGSGSNSATVVVMWLTLMSDPRVSLVIWISGCFYEVHEGKSTLHGSRGGRRNQDVLHIWVVLSEKVTYDLLGGLPLPVLQSGLESWPLSRDVGYLLLTENRLE